MVEGSDSMVFGRLRRAFHIYILFLGTLPLLAATCRGGTQRVEAPIARPQMPPIVLPVSHYAPGPVPGDCRTDVYLPMLKDKRVGVVCNHTARIGERHLIDTLRSSGVNVVRIFAPEHGFRGDVGAGERIATRRDPATGIEIVSIYGASKKPSPAQMRGLDVMVFDIQDVGVRFYTYLSSMHYVMESCAEEGVTFVVLDRPNPNGMYVDGPLLDMRHRSFVGMHPIPVVHGMTLGELALMINDSGWLAGKVRCRLMVVECLNYRHSDRFSLTDRPSPNLPNMRAVHLYPSLCLLEATPVSVGRGTPWPFQIYGHPSMKKHYDFAFTPQWMPEAHRPPLGGRICYGVDLRTSPSDRTLVETGFDLHYLIDAYRTLNIGETFFTPFFEKLIGVDYPRKMIIEGHSAAYISKRWHDDVERFRRFRHSYLLYEE